MQAADTAGIRAILVHAISEEAKRFYERCGFQPSPITPMTLMINLSDAQLRSRRWSVITIAPNFATELTR